MADDKTLSMNRAGEIFTAGLWGENPVLRLLLGMCPTLAVTASLAPALTMGICTMSVLICSNIVVSLMRNLLKPHLRILMFVLTISTFVTIADMSLRAFLPEMSEALGPYVPLIIVNCMIIGRAEACASRSGLGTSIVDALGMGLGFTLTLGTLGAFREVLSTGNLLGIPVMPEAFVPLAAFRMPVGAFVGLGLMLAIVNLITRKDS